MTALKTAVNGGIDIDREDLSKAHAALMLQRARLMGILGLTLFPVFGISDWIDYHSFFPLWVRLFATLLILVAYTIGFTKWGSHHPFHLASVCIIIVALSLAVIMWHQND